MNNTNSDKKKHDARLLLEAQDVLNYFSADAIPYAAKVIILRKINVDMNATAPGITYKSARLRITELKNKIRNANRADARDQVATETLRAWYGEIGKLNLFLSLAMDDNTPDKPGTVRRSDLEMDRIRYAWNNEFESQKEVKEVRLKIIELENKIQSALVTLPAGSDLQDAPQTVYEAVCGWRREMTVWCTALCRKLNNDDYPIMKSIDAEMVTWANTITKLRTEIQNKIIALEKCHAELSGRMCETPDTPHILLKLRMHISVLKEVFELDDATMHRTITPLDDPGLSAFEVVGTFFKRCGLEDTNSLYLRAKPKKSNN